MKWVVISRYPLGPDAYPREGLSVLSVEHRVRLAVVFPIDHPVPADGRDWKDWEQDAFSGAAEVTDRVTIPT